MASGLAVSIVPSIVSSGIFSSRRFNSGMDAMAANNLPVGIMNCDIAGGQITNLFQGAVDIAKESKNAISAKILSAEEMIKNASQSSKALSAAKSALEFTGRYINPIICVTGVVRTATADDKIEEGCEQLFGIGTMLTGENIAKKAVCIPITKRVNGKRVVEQRYAWYKNHPIINKQVEAFTDACATKKILGKSLKFVPSAGKGIVLVGTSIASFIVGNNIGHAVSKPVKKILGDVPKYSFIKNNEQTQSNHIELNSTKRAQPEYIHAA